MGGMNKTDPDQKLQERTQTGQYLPTPEQREQCLAELKGGSVGSGSDRADPFQTQTPECVDTVRRPVRKDLDEKGLKKPGMARACVAPSLEHPEGLPSGRHLHMGKNRTVMQQHVDFWDTNQDGVISMWDTYIGFRRLGFGIPFSVWAVFVINPAFSLASSPHWYPDPLMRVYTNNIHRGKHGSDQEVYDHEGRFIPQRFEDLWSKWDHEGKGSLSARDIWEMTQSTWEAMDFFGWFAGKFEWYTSWLLAADEKGLLRKEAVRAIYDGSLFFKLEDKFWHGKPLPQEYKGMGEGGYPSAILKRWREGRRAKTSSSSIMHEKKSGSLEENLARREAIKTGKSD